MGSSSRRDDLGAPDPNGMATSDARRSEDLNYCYFLSWFGVSNPTPGVPQTTLTISSRDVIIAIIRVITTIKVSFAGDITSTGVLASIFVVLEPAIAIMVACFPVYRPLLESSFLREFVASIHSIASSLRGSHRSSHHEEEDRERLNEQTQGRAGRSEEFEMHNLDKQKTSRAQQSDPGGLEHAIEGHNGIGVRKDIVVSETR